MYPFNQDHWTDIALTIVGGILTFITLRWLSNKIHWIRDGLNKKEFAALIFIAILIWMRWRDGHREHEWRYFSDLDYMTTYAFIAVGLGLSEIIEAIYAFKGVRKDAKNVGE